MPEPSVDVVALVLDRLAPAITCGLAAGLLGWLLGLARSHGGLGIAATVTAAFLAAAWPGAIVVTLTLVVAGLIARVAHATGGSDPLPAAKLGGGVVLALTAVALLCAVLALQSVAPTYWLGAMCGSLTAALATWTGRVTTAAGSGDRYALWTLRRVSDPDGGLNAVALLVAASTMLALSVAGLRLHLVGPGDPAMIFIATVASTATATSPGWSAAAAVTRSVLLAAVLGAILSATLMALVP